MQIVTLFAAGAALAAATPILAAEPKAPAVAPTTDRMQETVCRRDKEIGSLVKSKKTCHTRAQWAYIDNTNQTFSRDLVDTTRTKSSSN